MSYPPGAEGSVVHLSAASSVPTGGRPAPGVPRWEVERELAAGDRLYQQGAWAAALAHYRRAAARKPAPAHTHYKLAYCAWHAGAEDLVESSFRSAVLLDPRHAWAHEGLALWLLYRDRLDEAHYHSAAAMALEPGNADFIVTLAYVLAGRGEQLPAWRALGPVLADPAAADRAAVLYLRVAPWVGREGAAIEWAYRRLGESDSRSPVRPRLHFALGALLERVGRYEEAIGQARLAHGLSPVRFDRATHRARTDQKIEQSTPAHIKSLPRSTNRSRRPVFIVGMFRSGTSLLEQVLSSHPQVFGAGELDCLMQWVAPVMWDTAFRAGGLERVGAADINYVAGRYLAELDRVNPTAGFVIDKMPLNFMHLDLIHMLFPECRVIHCVRNPAT